MENQSICGYWLSLVLNSTIDLFRLTVTSFTSMGINSGPKSLKMWHTIGPDSDQFLLLSHIRHKLWALTFKALLIFTLILSYHNLSLSMPQMAASVVCLSASPSCFLCQEQLQSICIACTPAFFKSLQKAHFYTDVHSKVPNDNGRAGGLIVTHWLLFFI